MNNIELKTYLQDLFPKEFKEILNAPGETKTIRVNTLKSNSELLTRRLKHFGIEYKPLFMNPDGFNVQEDSFALSHTLDFFKGDFFYQGTSSQIPPLILDPKPGDRVLDIAAAPGSKTSQLGALLQNRGILIANDISRSRIQSLNVNT
jgi:ribosomal RNA methyltransferase Nop2